MPGSLTPEEKARRLVTLLKTIKSASAHIDNLSDDYLHKDVITAYDAAFNTPMIVALLKLESLLEVQTALEPASPAQDVDYDAAFDDLLDMVKNDAKASDNDTAANTTPAYSTDSLTNTKKKIKTLIEYIQAFAELGALTEQTNLQGDSAITIIERLADGDTKDQLLEIKASEFIPNARVAAQDALGEHNDVARINLAAVLLRGHAEDNQTGAVTALRTTFAGFTNFPAAPVAKRRLSILPGGASSSLPEHFKLSVAIQKILPDDAPAKAVSDNLAAIYKVLGINPSDLDAAPVNLQRARTLSGSSTSSASSGSSSAGIKLTASAGSAT